MPSLSVSQQQTHLFSFSCSHTHPFSPHCLSYLLPPSPSPWCFHSLLASLPVCVCFLCFFSHLSPEFFFFSSSAQFIAGTLAFDFVTVVFLHPPSSAFSLLLSRFPTLFACFPLCRATHIPFALTLSHPFADSIFRHHLLPLFSALPCNTPLRAVVRSTLGVDDLDMFILSMSRHKPDQANYRAAWQASAPLANPDVFWA